MGGQQAKEKQEELCKGGTLQGLITVMGVADSGKKTFASQYIDPISRSSFLPRPPPTEAWEENLIPRGGGFDNFPHEEMLMTEVPVLEDPNRTIIKTFLPGSGMFIYEYHKERAKTILLRSEKLTYSLPPLSYRKVRQGWIEEKEHDDLPLGFVVLMDSAPSKVGEGPSSGKSPFEVNITTIRGALRQIKENDRMFHGPVLIIQHHFGDKEKRRASENFLSPSDLEKELQLEEIFGSRGMESRVRIVEWSNISPLSDENVSGGIDWLLEGMFSPHLPKRARG